ncbi:MAG: hypothetical protein ABSG78_20980 [Verrucomicrobiota bacterium]
MKIYGAGRKSQKRPALVVGKKPNGKCQLDRLIMDHVLKIWRRMKSEMLASYAPSPCNSQEQTAHFGDSWHDSPFRLLLRSTQLPNPAIQAGHIY